MSGLVYWCIRQYMLPCKKYSGLSYILVGGSQFYQAAYWCIRQYVLMYLVKMTEICVLFTSRFSNINHRGGVFNPLGRGHNRNRVQLHQLAGASVCVTCARTDNHAYGVGRNPFRYFFVIEPIWTLSVRRPDLGCTRVLFIVRDKKKRSLSWRVLIKR